MFTKYLSLFLFSAIVMFIEIIGAKVLTPILGGSQTVWISQIFITLLSLAIGGYLSSRINQDKIKRISTHIYASALYLLTCVFFLNSIVEQIIRFDFTIASILLSVILYTYPLVSLGMIFPSLYQILEKDHGQNLGKVYFVGTLGSILGTVMTYVSVYLTTNINLLIIASIIQILVSFLLSYNKKIVDKAILVPILLVLGSSFLNKSNNDNNVLFHKNSHFGELILIQDKEENLILVNDGISQNGVNKDGQSIHLFSYAIERLPFLYKDNIESTLILGFGIGMSVDFLHHKGQKIEAVEINPEMIELTKEKFPHNLNGVDLHIQDARFFVKKNQNKYDSILLDCFLVDFVPKHLLTLESFSEIKRSLNEDGILTINSFGTFDDKMDILNSSIYRTLKLVFRDVHIYSLNDWNIFFVASDSLNRTIKADYYNMPKDIQVMFDKLLLSRQDYVYENGIVLNDNSSQIDVLDNVPRELYRKKNSYK